MALTPNAEVRLRAGELAVLPTDTVYGLACAASRRDTCAALYVIKDRPVAQPTSLMLGSVDKLLESVLPELQGTAAELCRRMLPGPVTLVVPNPGRRFAYLCGTTADRIGVRVPQLEPEVAALADALDGLAVTSANLRGAPAPARLEEVATELLRASGVVMDGGTLPGAPSAVIDVVGPVPLVLRRAPGVDEVLERLGP